MYPFIYAYSLSSEPHIGEKLYCSTFFVSLSTRLHHIFIMNRSNWRVERLTKAPLRATDDDDMRSSSTSTTRQRHQRRGSAARSTAEGTMESSLFPDEDDDTDDESPGAYAITRDKRPSTAGLSNLDRQIQEEQEDEWDPTAGPDEFAAGLSNLDQEIVEEQEDEWDPNVDPDEVFMDGEVHVAAAAPNVSNNEHSDDIITNKNCSNSSKRRRIIIAFVVGVVVLIIAATVGIVVGLGRTTTDPEKDQPMLSSNNTTTSHPESHAVFTSDCATSTEVVSAEGRYSSFRSRLEAQFPDIIANVDIPLSTERLALCWLADFDDKAREELRFQRFLLALVYFHFINQQQQSNSKRLVESDVEFGNAWLGDEHECEWEHVDCSVEEAKVTELHLSDIGLHGKIPTFLSHFTNLVSLNLSFNTLTGEIPSDLRNSMPQLLSLYLASNQLSGAIGSVSNLSRLSLLAVNSNWFTGTIPDLSALSNLQFLELGSNDFEGSFPDLSSATNLGESSFCIDCIFCFGELLLTACLFQSIFPTNRCLAFFKPSWHRRNDS